MDPAAGDLPVASDADQFTVSKVNDAISERLTGVPQYFADAVQAAWLPIATRFIEGLRADPTSARAAELSKDILDETVAVLGTRAATWTASPIEGEVNELWSLLASGNDGAAQEAIGRIRARADGKLLFANEIDAADLERIRLLDEARTDFLKTLDAYGDPDDIMNMGGTAEIEGVTQRADEILDEMRQTLGQPDRTAFEQSYFALRFIVENALQHAVPARGDATAANKALVISYATGEGDDRNVWTYVLDSGPGMPLREVLGGQYVNPETTKFGIAIKELMREGGGEWIYASGDARYNRRSNTFSAAATPDRGVLFAIRAGRGTQTADEVIEPLVLGARIGSLAKVFPKGLRSRRFGPLSWVSRAIYKGKEVFVKINKPVMEGRPLGKVMTAREIYIMEKIKADAALKGMTPDFAVGTVADTAEDAAIVNTAMREGAERANARATKQPEGSAKSKFEREGANLSSSSFESMGFAGQQYMAINRAEGISAASYLQNLNAELVSAKKKGRSEVAKVEAKMAATLQSLMKAMRTLHSRGVYHRDLSLDEIFVNPVTGEFTAFLDFGVAMVMERGADGKDAEVNLDAGHTIDGLSRLSDDGFQAEQISKPFYKSGKLNGINTLNGLEPVVR